MSLSNCIKAVQWPHSLSFSLQLFPLPLDFHSSAKKRGPTARKSFPLDYFSCRFCSFRLILPGPSSSTAISILFSATLVARRLAKGISAMIPIHHLPGPVTLLRFRNENDSPEQTQAFVRSAGGWRSARIIVPRRDPEISEKDVALPTGVRPESFAKEICNLFGPAV